LWIFIHLKPKPFARFVGLLNQHVYFKNPKICRLSDILGQSKMAENEDRFPNKLHDGSKKS